MHNNTFIHTNNHKNEKINHIENITFPIEIISFHSHNTNICIKFAAKSKKQQRCFGIANWLRKIYVLLIIAKILQSIKNETKSTHIAHATAKRRDLHAKVDFFHITKSRSTSARCVHKAERPYLLR